jgi:uncharacterized protein YhaN
MSDSIEKRFSISFGEDSPEGSKPTVEQLEEEIIRVQDLLNQSSQSQAGYETYLHDLKQMLRNAEREKKIETNFPDPDPDTLNQN